jgi:hypothetical protein
MVGLFSLPYTIPYKGKTGRDLDSRQAAYEVLLDSMKRHLPELDLPRNERWAALRTTASGAQRKFELERIEDEIDAIVCAHLAWLWAHRPGALQVYGDVQTGYIVAPPPPSHPPAPRVAQGSPVKEGMPPGSPSAVVPPTGDVEDLAVDLLKAVPRLTLEEARLLATRARQHFRR